MRKLIQHNPFGCVESLSAEAAACRWVACPDVGAPPLVTAYRRSFTVNAATTVMIHVTADERYQLFLDGRLIGCGSERGDVAHWFFETYELSLDAGEHMLVARVWSQGKDAPYAQHTVEPGWLLLAEGPWHASLTTGVATWQAKRLGGYDFLPRGTAFGVGDKLDIDGRRFDWGFERGEGDGWQVVTLGAAAAVPQYDTWGHGSDRPHLRPAMLPAMLDEPVRGGRVRFAASIAQPDVSETPIREAQSDVALVRDWDAMWRDGRPVRIAPRTIQRVLIDLDQYICAYPVLTTSGGRDASVQIQWQEALYCESNASQWRKDQRDRIEGLYFAGIGDRFTTDGGALRRFDTLWWQAGRYLQLIVQTADEPLTIDRLELRETRYPLQMDSRVRFDDESLNAIQPIMLRGLQMCSHETYMDCPYYEQLMYVGDTRLEVLTTYAIAADDRLPRKAVRLFDWSRLSSGLTTSRYPSRISQVIPPFSLWWVAMVYDYAMWREDLELVRDCLPTVRSVIETYLRHVRGDGLLDAVPGWNFTDWVPAWNYGIPPQAATQPSGPIHWHLIYTLGLAADLEACAGEPELGRRCRRAAKALARTADKAFYDRRRGLLADDLEHRHFSEHSQCLALLGGQLPTSRRQRIAHELCRDANDDLARTTIYFTHYLFETFAAIGRIDRLIDRLALWRALPQQGFRTTPEMPEPSRSDCHGWGAHPLYHYLATLVGIRPAAPGFAQVRIAPQLGPISHAQASMVHPRGRIEVQLQRSDQRMAGRITLPRGVTGALLLADQTLALHEGEQRVEVAL